MYINNKEYDKYKEEVRPLSKKEIILMAKQLGMMRVLYAARKDFWEMQTSLRLYTHTPEFFVLNSLTSQQSFFGVMDKWEKKHKQDGRAFIRYIKNQ